MQELRTLVTRLYPLPTSAANWQAFEELLLNCSTTQAPMEPLGVGVGPDGKEVQMPPCPRCAADIRQVWVTEQLIANCTGLLKLFETRAKTIRRYQHEKQDESNVAFKMIRDDLPKVMTLQHFALPNLAARRWASWTKSAATRRSSSASTTTSTTGAAISIAVRALTGCQRAGRQGHCQCAARFLHFFLPQAVAV